MESAIMKSERAIKKLVGELDMQIDPGVDRRILDRTLGRLRESVQMPSAAVRLLRWSRTMRGPAGKLAGAGAMVVAALLGQRLFSATSGIAWAMVLMTVKAFDTCVYRSRTVETTGRRPDGFEFACERETRIRRSGVVGSYEETYENGELACRSYCLLAEGQRLTFHSRCKWCCRGTLSDKDVHEFERSDPKRIVAKILEAKYAEIGKDTIDGRAVTGVELRDPSVLANEDCRWGPLDDFSARFWIDMQNKLPVWVEISAVAKGSPTRTTAIWDQFQWGVPLEASVFVPEIPGDYEVADMPHREDPVPDPTPNTEAEKAFVENTRAEPYLGDFDHLALPDVSDLKLLGVVPDTPRPPVRLLGFNAIMSVHDACVAGWPRYEQVQAQLRQELQDQLDIEAFDVNHLVATGIALRNLFWEIGGCLNDNAYPYIYAARLLDETAHAKATDNSAVIDQLLESIVATEVLYYWSDPAPVKPQRNPVYGGLIADLLYRQFELVKARTAQGHTPTWKDFVRCGDCITASRLRKDNAMSLEVTRFLIAHTEKGGWTYYLERLRRNEQSLAADKRGRAPVTFVGGIGDVGLAQYTRRLWSFQGPQEFRATRQPNHLEALDRQ